VRVSPGVYGAVSWQCVDMSQYFVKVGLICVMHCMCVCIYVYIYNYVRKQACLWIDAYARTYALHIVLGDTFDTV
jgi:hypothetical protein